MPPVTLASNDTSVLNLPSGPRAAAAPSLLGSLVIAARHRGIHLSTTQLIRDHQLRNYACVSPCGYHDFSVYNSSATVVDTKTAPEFGAVSPIGR